MTTPNKIVDFSNSSINRFSIPDLKFSQKDAMRFASDTNGTPSEIVTKSFGRGLLTLLNAESARTTLELGDVALRSASEFATALQGQKAETAVQPQDIQNLLQDVGTKSFEFRKTENGTQWRYAYSEGEEDGFYTYAVPLGLYDGQTVVINATPLSIDKSFLLYIDNDSEILEVTDNVDHPTAVFGAPHRIIFVNEDTQDKFSITVNEDGFIEIRQYPDWKDWFSFRDVMSQAEPLQFRVNGTDIEWRAYSENEEDPWNLLFSFNDLVSVIDFDQFATAAQGQKADTALQNFNFTSEGKIRIGGSGGFAQELQTTANSRSLLTATSAEQMKASIWNYLIETRKESKLTWDPYTTTSPQGYYVYWRVLGDTPWNKITLANPSVTEYSILALGRDNINKTLEFRVTAYWNSGSNESMLLVDKRVDFSIAWGDFTPETGTTPGDPVNLNFTSQGMMRFGGISGNATEFLTTRPVVLFLHSQLY